VNTLRWRRFVNVFWTVASGTGVLFALVPLVSLLWLVISHGAKGLSLSFFVSLPTPVGEPGGGVGNAIVGTFFMVGLASLMALPVGVGAGVYLAEKGNGPLGRGIRFTAEVLSGVPSIVIGIVAYGLIVAQMKRFSALAGGVALALIMIPTALREASLALGVPGWKTSLRVIIPTALGGIVTAVLLAVARAAGETAPLLFTALNNQYWNTDPTQPTASLTVQIYNYAISPYEDWHSKAWTAALVLLMLVGLLNLAARFLSRNRMAGAR
jgi:phosphate transport system permease protein